MVAQGADVRAKVAEFHVRSGSGQSVAGAYDQNHAQAVRPVPLIEEAVVGQGAAQVVEGQHRSSRRITVFEPAQHAAIGQGQGVFRRLAQGRGLGRLDQGMPHRLTD